MEDYQNMLKNYLLPLLATAKNSIIAALSVFTAFVAPMGDLLFFVSLLIVSDFVTGVVAAKHRGEIRSSAKMIKSVYKMIFYFTALIAMQLFDQLTAKHFHPHFINILIGHDNAQTLSEFKFLAALAFIIIMRELKSIDENWSTIFGWSFIATGMIVYDKLLTTLTSLKKLKDEKIRN
jgi:phage-related holin